MKTTSPQNVVVFAIDEGILQVARYRLKDPLDYFFRKRALEVKSTQILDLILPEFSKMMALTAAPGGDTGEESICILTRSNVSGMNRWRTGRGSPPLMATRSLIIRCRIISTVRSA